MGNRLSAPQRRASIVAAAMEVFAELGYQRGTMAEVARRVGVSEPVVFQNFGSKPAVFAAVVAEATARMTAGIQQRVAAAGSVGAWLPEFLRPSHAGTGHQPHHVLFADALAHRSEPAVLDAVRQAHRTLARTLAGLLAQGQAEGSVRAEVDPATGAWWLLSLFASRDFRAATMPDRRRLEGQLATLTRRTLMTDQVGGPAGAAQH